MDAGIGLGVGLRACMCARARASARAACYVLRAACCVLRAAWCHMRQLPRATCHGRDDAHVRETVSVWPVEGVKAFDHLEAILPEHEHAQRGHVVQALSLIHI